MLHPITRGLPQLKVCYQQKKQQMAKVEAGFDKQYPTKLNQLHGEAPAVLYRCYGCTSYQVA
jgi:hypothetical protein